ncbi:MAG: B12-binding domain-containing protein [Candidatus Lokiarchaeia archaeon]
MAEKDLLSKLRESLLSGDQDEAMDNVILALDKKLAIQEILTIIANAMDEVGKKFQNKEYYLTDLIMSGAAAEEVIGVVTPYIKAEEIEYTGNIVIGTVEGDIHDLGKTLVIAILNSAGFRVYDLGVDVPASRYVQKAAEVNADIVASSALLTTTKDRMKDIEDELVKTGIRDKVKTLIGGATVSAEYAREIGADGYAKDAFEAVTVAKSLVNKLRSKGGE